MKNIEKKVGLIHICVDFRTELLGIIQILSNNPLTETDDNFSNQKYISEIEKRFGKYRNHPVIKMDTYYREKYGFDYDAPITMFLQLDEHFKTDKLNDYILYKRLDGDESIYQYIGLLEDFANEIGFEKYYNEKQQQYESYINQLVTPLENYDVTEYLKNYYNIAIADKVFTINILPFQKGNAYGSTIDNHIYSSLSSATVRNCREDSDITFVIPGKEFRIASLILHEFSHSIINPLTDKLNLISEEDDLFDEIKDIMKKQAYSINSAIMNEHIIRGVQARYQYKYDRAGVEQYITNLEKNGFIFIRTVIESLEYYENNRNIYLNFESFYPIIVENMRAKKKQDKLNIEE